MTAETSAAVRKWDALPGSLRHPKNLAMLAVEHLALLMTIRCSVLVVQDADYRDPRVSVLVEMAGGAEQRRDPRRRRPVRPRREDPDRRRRPGRQGGRR
ncbi:hypothetical protein [uncultured Serinicoccus sp.]|uniref:hypothetical protein n=1 Tax=uncultured Serinicoccus sp. TaxID=735514 RepID=UPI00262ADDD2|nr:hypothetical protein [uncultured Serinicoccus sp.]